ncbi:MAG: saccharopine dehydrogenase NADP-binding domain-containing protein [bacterium]|nr:saccharopine dehydrogenase NADP-binding domain-containing protein [bacterium]
MTNWMIYGASGYTGMLAAEEAVRRGHRPILAGRSAEKLKPIAERLGLKVRAFPLDDVEAVAHNLDGMQAVYHAAGPFIHTSLPMLKACLQAKVHYLDITGEYPVFEQTFDHDAAAREAGVALISGVGFDVIPTDSLAKYVAEQVPQADTLDIAFAAISRASAGTTKSMLELMPQGGRVRRHGVLQTYRLGRGARRIRFSDRWRDTLPIPWGDVSTAYRTTGIPNITTYMAYPAAMIWGLEIAATMTDVTRWLAHEGLRRGLTRLVDRFVEGPDNDLRTAGRSYIWAKAADARGHYAQAWMEVAEGYAFTALAAPLVVERLLANPVTGATTPALAFGADFVLEIPGSVRLDSLPSEN